MFPILQGAHRNAQQRGEAALRQAHGLADAERWRMHHHALPGGHLLRCRQQFSSLNAFVQENISGNRVVRAFAKEDFEKKYIESALEKNKGNITLTAKDIGIERTNLHRKIKQYNIENSGYSDDE